MVSLTRTITTNDPSETDPRTGKRIVRIQETLAEICPRLGKDGFLFVQREATGRLLWFSDGTARWEGLNRYSGLEQSFTPRSRDIRELNVPGEMRRS
jgi:hypothetical protein